MNSNEGTLFAKKLSTLCWIGYTPTYFDPGNNLYPSTESIYQDLIVLKKAGFNGLVTYGSEQTLALIPEIAKKIGYKGIIMGIRDPYSPAEINNAFNAKEFVDAYCAGHLGLNRKYFSLKRLNMQLIHLKNQLGRPVSTSESIQLYHGNSEMVKIGDWVFPDARLFWDYQTERTPEALFSHLTEEYERLIGLTEKPVLIKAVGFPSGGSGKVSEDSQKDFFQHLLTNASHPSERVRFVYFEGFDQFWKTYSAVEPHWGLFTKQRIAKPAAGLIWGKTIKVETPYSSLVTPQSSIKFQILSVSITVLLIVSVMGLIILMQQNGIILLERDKTILRIKHGEEKVIKFSSKHNQCFEIFLLFYKNRDRGLFCGEIVSHIRISDSSIECEYSDHELSMNRNMCPLKRQFCKAYRRINNHRISIINKLVKNNGIGEIVNNHGSSIWRLNLSNKIFIKVA